MKKVLFVVSAFATLSFAACSSGEHKTETMDSTQVSNTVDEVVNAVQDSTATMDSSAMKMMDTTKKM
jgi:hypothetical protein